MFGGTGRPAPITALKKYGSVFLRSQKKGKRLKMSARWNTHSRCFPSTCTTCSPYFILSTHRSHPHIRLLDHPLSHLYFALYAIAHHAHSFKSHRLLCLPMASRWSRTTVAYTIPHTLMQPRRKKLQGWCPPLMCIVTNPAQDLVARTADGKSADAVSGEGRHMAVVFALG